MKKVLYSLFLVAIGFSLGIGASRLLTKKPVIEKLSQLTSQDYELHSGGYKYVNPLLECEYTEELGGPLFGNLEANLAAFVEAQNQAGKASHISIYIRDLNNGPWAGVNEREKFAPASLLKIPVMMTYYKDAEKDADILDQELSYEQRLLSQEQIIKPEQELQIGKRYKVPELIDRMILYSDNEAMKLLTNHMGLDKLDQTFKELGIENFGWKQEDFMSVRTYASFFRVLFNASYLSPEMSERALELLSRTTYDFGIRKGVPQELAVARKFGERSFTLDTHQIHDCGVVYYPNKPYLLCVMTRGSNVETLKQVVQEVSAKTYQELDVRYKKQ